MKTSSLFNTIKSINQDIDDNSAGSLASLCLSIFTSQRNAEDFIAQNLCLSTNVEDIIEKLKVLQISNIQQVVNPHKKTIAFSHTIPAFREHFGNLPSKLRLKGYNVLILLGTPKHEYHGFEDDEYVFYAGHGIIKDIDFVDLFIHNTNSTKHLPVNGKKAFIPHGSSFLPNIENVEIKGYLRNLTRHINANFLAYDHFILQSKVFVNLSAHILKELCESDFAFFKDRVPKEMLNHKSKELCIVPAGYPKLDMLIDYFEKNKKVSKTIIYATTDLDHENSSLKKFGNNIIDTILRMFPDYDFIFRPHPGGIERAEVLDVVNKYSNHPRFFFDDNPSYRNNYAKCTVLISDFSGTAETYSLATLKPVIIIEKDFVEQNILDYNQNEHVELPQCCYGFNARNSKEMLFAIKAIINNSICFKEKIENLRNTSLANIGTSEDYIVNNIEYILDGRKNKNWIYIPLFSGNGQHGTETEFMDCIRRLLSDGNFPLAVEVSSTAVKKFPDNFLLLWLHALSLKNAGKPEESNSAVNKFTEIILKVSGTN